MSTNGLILIKNAKQLKDEEAALKERIREEEASNKYDSYELNSQLSSRIRDSWFTNRRHKQEILFRLFACLRARKGSYSDGELQEISKYGGSDPVYIKLTSTKCRAASSWIRDLLLPPGDELSFGLEATPEPTLPPDLEKQARTQAVTRAAAMFTNGVEMTPEELPAFIEKVKENTRQALNKKAREAAERMEIRIKDTMFEGSWERALEETIEDFVTYPAAFMKGPYLKTEKVMKWDRGIPVPAETVKLAWRRVSPFDIYPAPYSETVQKGDLIERLRLTQDQIYALIGLEGYNEKELREVLQEYDRGSLIDWIWEDWERERLESSSSYFISDAKTIDALHFWGSVQGKSLKDWGVTTSLDEDKFYEVDALLIGRHVVRAVVNENPLGQRPYHTASWDSIPGAIWGIALPEQMEEHQKIINATARALCTNMSISAGPQIEINTDRLSATEDITGIYPMKIWQTKSSLMSGDNRPALQFFQPSINSEQLLPIFNTFEQKADDVTNVPRYSYGSEKVGGAGSTATGLSMLMSSAAKGIRRAIAHIDLNMIQPTVYQTFVYLMLNDPDTDIHGDITVIARGSTATIVKEQAQSRMQSFLRESAEMIGPNTRDELIRRNAELLGLNLDEFIEADAQLKKQMMAEQQQMQKAAMDQTLASGAQEQAAVSQSLDSASKVQ